MLKEWLEARLSLMKTTPEIVAVGRKLDTRAVIVCWNAELNQWEGHLEQGSEHNRYWEVRVLRDEDMLSFMAFFGGIGRWQMREQTDDGLFETIFTYPWNEVHDDEPDLDSSVKR